MLFFSRWFGMDLYSIVFVVKYLKLINTVCKWQNYQSILMKEVYCCRFIFLNPVLSDTLLCYIYKMWHTYTPVRNIALKYLMRLIKEILTHSVWKNKVLLLSVSSLQWSTVHSHAITVSIENTCTVCKEEGRLTMFCYSLEWTEKMRSLILYRSVQRCSTMDGGDLWLKVLQLV